MPAGNLRACGSRAMVQSETAVGPVSRDGIHTPERRIFLEDVRAGLTAERKSLPCKYFYDARGSKLFDRICELEEYYLTRTEICVMQAHIGSIVDALGERCTLVEYGSGSSRKTRILLDHLIDPVAYVPVDIARSHLEASAAQLREEYPAMPVFPVCADYSSHVKLPEVPAAADNVVVYFPGSTIGNMDHAQATEFLERIAALTGRHGGLLIGVDLEKDPAVLEAAYNDREGVSAAFNKNVLRRANCELGTDFNLSEFKHRATYNEQEHRIESHLVSLSRQNVVVDGISVQFDINETIHTENSYKYSLERFAALARDSGFAVEQVWTDDRDYFSVQFLRPVDRQDGSPAGTGMHPL